MSSDDPTTLEALLAESAKLLEPLGDVNDRGPYAVLRLAEAAGLDLEAILVDPAELERISTEISETITVLEPVIETGEIPDSVDVADLTRGLKGTIVAIQRLDDLAIREDADVDVESIGKRLLDHLVVRYLSSHRPGVFAFLQAVSVVEQSDGEVPDVVHFDDFDDLIQDPNALLAGFYGWGTEEFGPLSLLLIDYLYELLWSVGVPASYQFPQSEAIDTFMEDSKVGSLYQLWIPIASYVRKDEEVTVGVAILPVPGDPDTGTLPGLVGIPVGVVSGTEEVPLGDDWTFFVEFSADVDETGLLVKPNVTSLVSFGDATTESPSTDNLVELHGAAEIRYTGDSDETTLLGDPEETRLAVGSVGARLIVEYDGSDVVFLVGFPATGVIVIDPEDLGGFLKKVLPADGIDFDFEVEPGWASDTGFYLETGGTLEVVLPQHAELGPITLTEIYLGLTPGGDGFEIVAATSAKVSLGPMLGTVDRVGISADVSFPEDRDGNLGIVDFDFGFEPPSGIGLKIDSGGVTGGGFLKFEPEKHRYAGGLELQFGSWGLKAVGLLKTKLPGTDGYSLLVLVTADLPPIQLGFGFVMTGIGGLAGIHRGFKKKPLGEAVRSGNLDSVLFPEDVVENADQILTDLRAIFPPKADRHVFGPMLRLDWGTPVIITAELGVLAAIPSWKIALLGKFMVDLPDDEAALIELNLAVVGVLDIPNEEFALDASLYDSRIVAWTVSGDMAMRLSWGDDSQFMLSVGGFHPRYDPPTGFPKLDRVTASLSPPGGNPRLELTGYLAVTPNTFQVGAGIVLHGEFGPAIVHGELSFDALFRFNPFSFVVDVHAGVLVGFKRFNLSLKIDGTLSGPQPYRIKGKLKIKILFIKVTVKVNATFGESGRKEELPTANVLPELAAQLEQPANWSAQKPADGHHLVTLQDPNADREGDSGEPQSDVVLAHPLGTLGVRQQVVPLGVAIEKYGNAKPRHTTYELSELSVAGSDNNLAGQRLMKEKFAPARFEEMSDSEKLQAEAFDRLPAGRTMDSGIVHYAGAEDTSLLSWATLAYESSVIDKGNDQYRLDTSDVLADFVVDDKTWDGRLDLALGHELAEQSAVATAETRTTGIAAYENSDTSKQIGVSDQRYVVAWTNDLERVAFPTNPAEGQARAEARAARDHYLAAHDVSSDDLQMLDIGDERYVVAWSHNESRVVFPTNPAEGQTRVEARAARDDYLASHDLSPDAVQVVGVQELGGGSGGDRL